VGEATEHGGASSAGQQRAAAELQAAEERLERLGRPLHAVVTSFRAPPRAPDGPLLGMPIAVKDMIDVAGHPRGNGNPEDMAGPPADADAPVVATLRAAAADVFAMSALLEYAAGAQHPELPEARNPVDPSRTAGGSSGGSAALVGAGVCPAALGTDTGGSIRIPAHYCGVVGFKPTFGTLPVEGVQPLAPTLDHVGLLARNVATITTVFEAMTGSSGVPAPERLRIGVLVDQLSDPRLDADVAERIRWAVRRLDAQMDLTERASGALDHLNDLIGDIVRFEAWQVHGPAMTARPEHFGAPTARLLSSAAVVTEARYRTVLRERDAGVPAALALLEEVDLLLGPAAPFAAPEVSPPMDTVEGADEGIFTGPYNVTGQPAIVLPCGVTPTGLPVGLQLAAAPGADALLLAAAAVGEATLRQPRV
jgi:Asp-tRNA(Asn)/Glu-tRNA(Gln) amidotransferase A subunit family amidase